jgi:hypothetical protein
MVSLAAPNPPFGLPRTCSCERGDTPIALGTQFGGARGLASHEGCLANKNHCLGLSKAKFKKSSKLGPAEVGRVKQEHGSGSVLDTEGRRIIEESI